MGGVNVEGTGGLSCCDLVIPPSKMNGVLCGDGVIGLSFGSFEVRKRAARTGRNPKTGEKLKIQAAIIKYRPSRQVNTQSGSE